MRGSFAVVIIASLLVLAAANEAEWDVIATASTASDPITYVATIPHRPIVVEAVVPPAPKVYNQTKSTPGPKCSNYTDCNSCIGLHFCLWTADNACIRAGTAKALKLQLNGKALAACVTVNNETKTTTYEIKQHRVARAKLDTGRLQPYMFRGVPVKIPLTQPEFVYPVNAIRTTAAVEVAQKNRNVFQKQV